MRGSATIGRVWGVPIRVHYSFALLPLLILLMTAGMGARAVLANMLWIVALFASVTFHELSHCAVAKRYGLEVRDIVLLPIGGVSEISGLPGKPRVERDIALAGPGASVLLGVVLGALALATGGHLWPLVHNFLYGSWLARLALLNFALAAFNLVPALPMDGGRVLRAILAGRVDEVRATRIATSVAQVFGALMIAAGVFYDLFLVVIGIFVLLGARAEYQAVSVRATLQRVRVGDVMVMDATTIQAGVTVQRLGPWLWSFPGRAVAVLDGDRYLGVIAAEDLTGAVPWAMAGNLCDRSAPVLDASSPLLPSAVEAFTSSRRNQLVVTYQGRVVGVLYRQALESVVRTGAGGRMPARDGVPRAA